MNERSAQRTPDEARRILTQCSQATAPQNPKCCWDGFSSIQRWSMKFPKTALVAGSLLFVLTARIAAEGQGVLGQGNVSCSSWLENHTSNWKPHANCAGHDW